ncbi:hypothetical protein ScPMuIL_017135 [Solemya velum]
MSKFRPLVVSGPSGCGKSTLVRKLFDEFHDCFAFSVSHTTRAPRPGEVEGTDYFFTSREEFDKMVQEDAFLEHAQFSGNRYGTSKKAVEEVQNTGRLCILDVEVNGVRSIKKTDLNARFIFIKPPSFECLRERLKGRGSESETSLNKRMETATEALEYASVPGSYDHVIVNDVLDVAYEKLKGIIIADVQQLQNERLKAGR